MKIDLTKMIYNNQYKIPVNGEIIIPEEELKNTEIRKISPVKVNGFIYNNEDDYELDINISGVMTLGCARTLKDVDYPFSIDIEENIGDNDDKILEIKQNSLDIFPIVWQNILVDIPLRVLAPDAKEESLEGDGWRLITEDDKKEEIDPRLKDLSKFNKE